MNTSTARRRRFELDSAPEADDFPSQQRNVTRRRNAAAADESFGMAERFVCPKFLSDSAHPDDPREMRQVREAAPQRMVSPKAVPPQGSRQRGGPQKMLPPRAAQQRVAPLEAAPPQAAPPKRVIRKRAAGAKPPARPPRRFAQVRPAPRGQSKSVKRGGRPGVLDLGLVIFAVAIYLSWAYASGTDWVTPAWSAINSLIPA